MTVAAIIIVLHETVAARELGKAVKHSLLTRPTTNGVLRGKGKAIANNYISKTSKVRN
ncbi:MAG: hypothetical protein WAK17_07300 [Candidatus Nitrosopolaris sp.]